VVREALETMDLTVIAATEILQAAGVGTMQRMQETKENDFASEFFKRVERNKKSIFLLGETDAKIARAKEELLKDFPKLVFVGEYAVENCVGNLEAVINDMNITAPDVIVSVLASPLQEHFLMEHKDKMNANIWYGVGEIGLSGHRRSLRNLLWSKMHMKRLKNNINKYKVQKEDEA